jgi:hypothetical protein
MAVDRAELERLLDLDTLSLQEIGQELGVSRQRIKQLADKMGYERTDQRVNPDKPVPAERAPRPWAAHKGGLMQWKRDNGICQRSGCLTAVSTKTLCREHADLMSRNAKARWQSGKII